MKKIFSLFAAALLIAACTPKEEVGTPFQAGQKVTLAASMGTDDAEQTSGKQRVSGVDNGTQINLTWDEGDQITVKVGDATAVFTLESGAGSASATFTGTMPAAGSTYQVSYPANYDESVLANQTYVANGFSKGLMKMSTKSDGTLDGGFVLSADNALLGLQLTGSDALSKIVLTNPATSKTYTLSCAGVTLSNTETLFYIVVPAGEWPNGFTVLVKDSEGNDITSFAKESAAIFSATEAMVMPVKEVEKPFVPEFVDLGLPSGLKWATCNVGAVTPEEYGDYFAWGEVETKANYTYQNYKWWTNGNYEQITKYCSNHSYGTRDNKKELEASDDAAAANWGEGWRIPTSTEFDELIDNCTWTWTTQNSVQGWKVSANGKSIFLPAAGSFSNVLQYAGSNGAYWTCSNNVSQSYYSYALIFTNSVKACDKENFRYVGYSVRPVQGEKIVLSLATLTTTVATQITENSALVGGNVTADGNATVTERGVVYSTSSNPTIANNKLASGNGTGSFTCTLTDLQDNTTYYVRAYATNSVGTAYGEEISFKTNVKKSLATLTTTAATQITENSALVGGNVTADGNATVTERGVVYSTSSNPTIANNKLASGSGTGSFTCTLTDLQDNTTYYVRAYATNSVGTAYGEEISFKTNVKKSLATLTTTAATQITANSALVGGNVTADGNATVTERGVVYGTSSNPTIDGNKLASGNGTGSFTCTLTGLQGNTTYYVRAYATNSVGTAYGAQISFTTIQKVYEYVDLGLSVKWATCNVGADSPEDYGDHFAWGEVEPKSSYSWGNYKWCTNGIYTQLTKYKTNSALVLEAVDDAATVNWGEDWRMPTSAELKELIDNCTWAWTTQNGVNGWKVTAKGNSNSIFLPAAGEFGNALQYVGNNATYWTSTNRGKNEYYYAYALTFSKSAYERSYENFRSLGCSVRPVRP